MTNYIVYRAERSNDVIAEGVTLTQAAIERLTHDGADYRLVEQQAGIWSLEGRSQHGAWTGLWAHKRPLLARAENAEAALETLAEQVINAIWRDGLEISTIESYREMQGVE